jgi:hypothetical protein
VGAGAEVASGERGLEMAGTVVASSRAHVRSESKSESPISIRKFSL